MPPMASTASPTSSRHRSGSVTSAEIAVPVPALVTTSASFSALRPTTVIPAPASAAARAAPRPMPAEPPTTRMRFPERSMSTCLPPTVR